jgi:hypothetical protein
MFSHVISYQSFDKEVEIDYTRIITTIIRVGLIVFVTEFIMTTTQYSKYLEKKLNILNLLISIILMIFTFIYSYWIVTIEGYYKTHLFMYFLWFVSTIAKILSTYFQIRIVADLINFFDPIWIMNIILISICDPYVNHESVPNKVTFYEIYFRFLEFHILVLGFKLLYFDRNIEKDISNQVYTLSGVIGKYDSFRFTVIILFSHYLFTFVNMLAFNIR